MEQININQRDLIFKYTNKQDNFKFYDVKPIMGRVKLIFRRVGVSLALSSNADGPLII